jgi:hypothetical protein
MQAKLFCGSASGSTGIENLKQDPDPNLEVMDPYPSPDLELNLNKNHSTVSNLIILTLTMPGTLI